MDHSPGQVLNYEVSVTSAFDIPHSIFDIFFLPPCALRHKPYEFDLDPSFIKRFSALYASAIDNDARTGAVRAEDPISRIKVAVILGHFFRPVFEFCATIHAIKTLCRGVTSTACANPCEKLLVAMWALHI